MYGVRIGDEWLHDPPAGDALSSVRLSCAANDVSTCEMVVPAGHPQAASLRVRDLSRPVSVWESGRCLFEGYVWEVAETLGGDLEVTCRGGLAWLADTTVPPYSTDGGDGVLRAPNGPSALLAWYVARHNERVPPAQRYAVGANEGDLLDPNAYVRRESSQRPDTLSEVMGKLVDPLGGVLVSSWDGSERRLDWFAECAGACSQVIDFGSNLTDYLRTSSADGMATALVAVGGTPEGADAQVTLDGMDEGEVAPGVMLSGGAVWDVSAVAERGWVCATHQSEALTAEGLLESAVRALGAGLQPAVTVEAEAVDLSLLGAAEPLVPGQYARVRSRPHGIDEYLLVTSADLDLDDPSRSRYTLGAPRGGYSERLRRLNASIRSGYDAVAAASAEARLATPVVATATSDSSSGAVTVELPDGTEVEAETSESVREGDEAIVTRVGAGAGARLVVTAVPGSGDRQDDAVEAARASAGSAQSAAEAAARQAAEDAREAGSRIDSVSGSLAALALSVEEERDERLNTMRSTPAGFEVGYGDSQLKLVLANDHLSFTEAGQELARASGGEFVAPVMRSDETHMGRWMWAARPNGDLALKWIGA